MYFNHYFLKIHFGAVDTWHLESQKRILELDFHFLHILDIEFHLVPDGDWSERFVFVLIR